MRGETIAPNVKIAWNNLLILKTFCPSVKRTVHHVYCKCKCEPGWTEDSASVSTSPLMQIVMLALMESIRGTLRTASLKLQSVLVSQTAQVWIIALNAFTVHASGGRTCSRLFFHLNCLRLCLSCLWGNNIVFLSIFSFTRFPHRPSGCTFSPVLSFFMSLSPSPSVSLAVFLPVSPYALRSTTQQPLNYSHQTTLCIFCAVPLHSSRIFPVSLFVCVCVRAVCTLSRTCTLAYVILHPFWFFCLPWWKLATRV